MDLRDVTKNQHFVPQVEQRLNAINPRAKNENQKIYSFSIIDRDAGVVSIDSEKGIRISKNLSLNDLFSFDVLGKEASKYNFEKLFHSYEVTIKSNTESLLSKIDSPKADIKTEILNIFSSKILNFIRNPYSIKRILNTFSSMKDLFPTDPVHYENFERVLNGNKPQKDHLCKKLGITENEYQEWLAIIFLLLTPMAENQINFLDQFIKRTYENPNSLIKVCIYTYDDEACLLSDRGFSFYELENNTTVWDFNLYSHGFIRYTFINIEESVPQDTPKEILDMLKLTSDKVGFMTESNDLIALEIYNQRTIELCHKKVFNSSMNCYGITVV